MAQGELFAGYDSKLRAMIILLLRRLPGKLNRIALCKNLFYSEMHFYQKYGRGISNSEYLHVEGSPVPRHFNELVSAMVAGGEIRVVPQVAPELIDGQQVMVLRGMVFESEVAIPSVLTREELRVLRAVSSTLQNELSLETRYFPQYYQHYVQTGLYQVIPFVRFAKRPHLQFKAWGRKIYRLLWQ